MTGHHCDKIKGAIQLDLDHNTMDEILAPIQDAFEGQIVRFPFSSLSNLTSIGQANPTTRTSMASAWPSSSLLSY